ncbi:MAG: SAM-dependent chlorinase/fluorinase [Acidobacteriota bacterium]|nr:SAM-dependent chlorinase/fluorinase [Acidobacteriota bacterium]
MGNKVIGLLTDFGLKDYFVASLKGVIFSINPEAQIVDITHDLPDYSLLAGAFILLACYRFFPGQTIFLTVVDPGVGSERRLLLAKSNRYYFIGPDNGLLSPVIEAEKAEVLEVTGQNYFLTGRRTSFEARDKIAPVAAWLSLGVELSELARPVKSFERLNWPQPQITDREIRGHIIYQDKFGNLITDISQGIIASFLNSNHSSSLVILAARKRISEMAATYSMAPKNKAFFMINSLGLLEIAIFASSAAGALGLGPGDEVVLKLE